ncbi:hypothetical protein [Spiroplasma endosymbiont of Clivina fossor]|uniref:hypothetical protein n=1 Tax=Spiroplasma endosymbiont of Clivina fossor TaxID=3066282 RepID=UPI00313AD4E6
MQEKDILKEINNIDYKTFMKKYQQLKNRAKKIEKKEKQVIFFNFVENSWYLLNILNFRYILIW